MLYNKKARREILQRSQEGFCKLKPRHYFIGHLGVVVLHSHILGKSDCMVRNCLHIRYTRYSLRCSKILLEFFSALAFYFYLLMLIQRSE